MARSYASTVIAAPADEVWARIRDFNGLPVWLGGLVVESEIEDGKAGDQDGGVRSFTLGDGTHIRERLLDDLRLRPRPDRPVGGLLCERDLPGRLRRAEGALPMSHHREEYRVEGMAEPLSHYTDAVKAGGLLFVSGIVPLDADGKLVGEGDVAEQARQVFRNMQLSCGGRLRVRRRGQGRALPARRRRPAEDQPGADGVLRRGASREHARRGLGARRSRRAARDRGGRGYSGLSRPLEERRSGSLGPSASARS